MNQNDLEYRLDALMLEITQLMWKHDIEFLRKKQDGHFIRIDRIKEQEKIENGSELERQAQVDTEQQEGKVYSIDFLDNQEGQSCENPLLTN